MPEIVFRGIRTAPWPERGDALFTIDGEPVCYVIGREYAGLKTFRGDCYGANSQRGLELARQHFDDCLNLFMNGGGQDLKGDPR